MKMILKAIGLSLLTSGLWAACMGPFCYDDTGASIGGLPVNGNGIGLPVVSSTTLNAITPYKGQMAYCSTCVSFNAALGTLCMSTGTVAGSFIAISSATAVSVCK